MNTDSVGVAFCGFRPVLEILHINSMCLCGAMCKQYDMRRIVRHDIMFLDNGRSDLTLTVHKKSRFDQFMKAGYPIEVDTRNLTISPLRSAPTSRFIFG